MRDQQMKEMNIMKHKAKSIVNGWIFKSPEVWGKPYDYDGVILRINMFVELIIELEDNDPEKSWNCFNFLLLINMKNNFLSIINNEIKKINNGDERSNPERYKLILECSLRNRYDFV